MIKGNDIIIIAENLVIACAKSCEINVDADIQEVCSASTGGWKEFISLRNSWSINISHLVTNVKSSVALVGKRVKLQIGKVTDGTRTLSADKVSGYAIITGWKCTATRGNLSSGTFTFQGTGSLS